MDRDYRDDQNSNHRYRRKWDKRAEKDEQLANKLDDDRCPTQQEGPVDPWKRP